MGNSKVKRLKQPEMITATWTENMGLACVGECVRLTWALQHLFEEQTKRLIQNFAPRVVNHQVLIAVKDCPQKRRHKLTFRIFTNSGDIIYLTVLCEYENVQEDSKTPSFLPNICRIFDIISCICVPAHKLLSSWKTFS